MQQERGGRDRGGESEERRGGEIEDKEEVGESGNRAGEMEYTFFYKHTLFLFRCNHVDTKYTLLTVDNLDKIAIINGGELLKVGINKSQT